jgi:hypothetical protein
MNLYRSFTLYHGHAQRFREKYSLIIHGGYFKLVELFNNYMVSAAQKIYKRAKNLEEVKTKSFIIYWLEVMWMTAQALVCL